MKLSLFGHLTMTLEPSHFMTAPTIIEDPQYLMVRTTYFRKYRLLRGRLTNLVVLAYVWKLLSSEKINVFYFSGSISKYVEHHFFCFRICCTDKNGFRDALRPKSPPLRRYLRIVHTDTFCKI